MNRKEDFFSWFANFRRGKVSGQLATFLILMMAVVFIFVAITMNISTIAQRKTEMDNAADNAAIRYASAIGSFVNSLVRSYRDLKPTTGKGCTKFNWSGFFKTLTLGFVGSFLGSWLGAWFGGVLNGTLSGILMGAQIGAIAGGIAGRGVGMGLVKMEQDTEIKAMNREFKKISPLFAALNLQEQIVAGLLLATVDDPVRVEDDRDWDEDDKYGVDGNGDPKDKISRFFKLYQQNLKKLTGSAQPNTGLQAVEKELVSEVNTFWDRVLLPFHSAVISNLNSIGEDRSNEWTPGLEEWLGYPGFFGLLFHLKYPDSRLNTSFAVSFWKPGAVDPILGCPDQVEECEELRNKYDEVDEFKDELEKFQDWYKGLELSDIPDEDARKARALAFSFWNLQLFDDGPLNQNVVEGENFILDSEGIPEEEAKPEETDVEPNSSDGQDWFHLSQKWSEKIDRWIPELEDKRDIIQKMLRDCVATGQCAKRYIDYMQTFINRINGHIALFNSFKRELNIFHTEIGDFVQRTKDIWQNIDLKVEALKEAYLTKTIQPIWWGLYTRATATYSWPDNRGWHHLRVEVDGPARMPQLSVKRKGLFKKCAKIKGFKGSVMVRIKRFDQDKNLFFSRNKQGVSLWNFRQRKHPEQPLLGDVSRNPDIWLNAYGVETLSQALYSPFVQELRVIYTERSGKKI